jgi:hypothetical protein
MTPSGLAPELIAEFVRTFQEEAKAIVSSADARRSDLKRDLDAASSVRSPAPVGSNRGSATTDS